MRGRNVPLRFVTVDEALAWHQIVIEQFGGDPGVRDLGLLESAIAQAQQGFGGEFAYSAPFGMATAYAFHISKNHPFVDGNKRVALTACVAFLQMNGWILVSRGTEAADALLDLILGKWTRVEFASWLEKRSAAEPDEVAAHRHSRWNRDEIQRSEICGCFHCRELFAPGEVVDWIQDSRGDTAQCPRCGIDSVIGSASGFVVASQLLERMHERWFTPPGRLSDGA
jgi:death-on-curing protein